MNKTVPTAASATDYVASIPSETMRADAETLVDLMSEVSGEPPTMWGDSIVGFGEYDITYASGREVKWVGAGFAARKRALTIYLSMDLRLDGAALKGLGPHTTGVGCLYIKRLADIDLDVLRRVIAQSIESTRRLAAGDAS